MNKKKHEKENKAKKELILIAEEDQQFQQWQEPLFPVFESPPKKKSKTEQNSPRVNVSNCQSLKKHLMELKRTSFTDGVMRNFCEEKNKGFGLKERNCNEVEGNEEKMEKYHAKISEFLAHKTKIKMRPLVLVEDLSKNKKYAKSNKNNMLTMTAKVEKSISNMNPKGFLKEETKEKPNEKLTGEQIRNLIRSKIQEKVHTKNNLKSSEKWNKKYEMNENLTKALENNKKTSENRKKARNSENSEKIWENNRKINENELKNYEKKKICNFLAERSELKKCHSVCEQKFSYLLPRLL